MNEQDLRKEIVTIKKKTGDIVINSPETYQLVSENIIKAKDARKMVVDHFKDMKTKAHEAWKTICGKEKEYLDPIDDFIKAENKKVSVYLTEQDRIKREAQRKADEERQKQEQAEREKLLARAEKAAAKGKEEKAAELAQAAEEVYVAPTIVESEVEQTTRTDVGTASQMRDINVTITDPFKILQAVVDKKLPVGIVTISEAKLKQAIKLNSITQLDGCLIESVVKAKYQSAAGRL